MRHVAVMSLTSSVGIMAIYLVDLFDILFISMLGHKEMAAAAGYGSTVLFFVSTINLGLSIASGALVAMAVGEKRKDRAREIATTAALIAIGMGILVPIAMIPYLPDLLHLIGARGDVSVMAQSYLVIILPATCFSGVSMTAIAVLRSRGVAKWSMYPSLAGALVNLIMDPILIFGFDLGLEGAAAATVMARVATCGLAIYASAVMRRGFSRIGWAAFRGDAPRIARFAVPAVASSIAAPVGQAIIMRYIAKFGPEAVAGLAVIGRLAPVVFSVVNALCGSIGPIIGQNFGAGRADRARSAYFDALKFLAAYVIGITLVLYLFRAPIADAFGAEGLTREILYFYCGPLALISFFNGAIFISNAAFNNLGYPGYSPILNWARNTLGILPFVAVGEYVMGVWGVAYGFLLGAVVFALISIWITVRLKPFADEARILRQKEMFKRQQEHELVHQGDSLHL
ncbi:MATE family efflux transporter [uncultured Roseovarius sp.]|uniref:MATE family efflux transporter n=1 Tax=uncultured Roseovarius sp. TaxID=293344 RepID=UPI002607783A|nr:MATE family efflux transporter [uncultured Roseovarius sp.]